MTARAVVRCVISRKFFFLFRRVVAAAVVVGWFDVATAAPIPHCWSLCSSSRERGSARQSCCTTTTAAAMRLVVQRVHSASVATTSTTAAVEEGAGSSPVVVSRIGPGILALVGLHQDDTEDDLQYCCKRLLGCKLWPNTNNSSNQESATGGLWRHSVKQKKFECMLVSQFTLYGTLSKKTHQPDYKLAMKAVAAQALYRQFVEMVRRDYGDATKIQDGVFGAMMNVSLVNDGPVTIIIDSRTPMGQQQSASVATFQGDPKPESNTIDDADGVSAVKDDTFTS